MPNKYANDTTFIFDKLKELIDKQNNSMVEYLNDSMTEDERNRHAINIMMMLESSSALIAKIKIDMLYRN